MAITYRDKKKDFGAIGTFVSLPELRNIMYKVKATATEGYVDALVFAPESYRLTDKLHSDYPDAQNVLSAGHKYDITTNIFDKLPYVFMDNCPSGKKAYVQIFGRENNKDRTYKWIKRSYIVQHDNLDKYKVLLPKSNGSGSFGEELSSPLVVSPGVGHTQTFLSIGAFDTKSEAQSLLKYVKTKFARTLLGVLKVTQDNKKSVWRFVPLQDFTENSDIDWSKSVKDIDRQLYAKYGLSDEEIAFIESNVKEMA